MIDSHIQTMMLAQQPPAPGEGAAPGPAGTTAVPGGPANGAGTGGVGGGGAGSGLGGSGFLIMVVLMIAIMLIFSMGSTRRERKRREAMLSSIKKHDRVQTIGGVIGSVVEIKPDVVVLKVDESSNTRITFSRAAIQQVLTVSSIPEAKEESVQ